MEDRPQTTDQIKHRHRPNKTPTPTWPPTTDHRPPTKILETWQKWGKQQNIYLFSIALVDFCDNFTSNNQVDAH